MKPNAPYRWLVKVAVVKGSWCRCGAEGGGDVTTVVTAVEVLAVGGDEGDGGDAMRGVVEMVWWLRW
uniref:Uncharacterized protein n=1 Tax=Tanacetum cinerariifolium TaxID=118510 RepID=A0A699Q4C6_TANCI|nr:hypothetical protein [Tanacetum cinerariifolium]